MAQTFAARGVVVVGVGADGWTGLGEEARQALRSAGAIVGSPRLLEHLPTWLGAERVEWRSPLRSDIRSLVEEHADRGLVVLASGDPLVHGIGRTLVAELGITRLLFLPTLSSVALACARLGWPSEDVDVVNAVGGGLAGLPETFLPGARFVVLSAGRDTPSTVASMLVDAGFGDSFLTVLGDLGSSKEKRWEGSAATWTAEIDAGMNVVAVDCRATDVRADDGGSRPSAADGTLGGRFPLPGWESGEGDLSARTALALIMSTLHPGPGECLWEVGGPGVCATEWTGMGRGRRAVVLDRLPDPAAKMSRPLPDAVVAVGAGLAPRSVEASWRALRPGGRVVGAGTTVDEMALLARYHRAMGGELTRWDCVRGISSADRGRTRWSGGGQMVLWYLSKPLAEQAER
ncbi:precorrin-6Y C5,15-methyltransferase (decarboxylating) [Austwickia chelonae]|nr:precorrin-6Y C5,15-methyltransferase (decarboxylating) [Austwickia chelonae]